MPVKLESEKWTATVNFIGCGYSLILSIMQEGTRTCRRDQGLQGLRWSLPLANGLCIQKKKTKMCILEGTKSSASLAASSFTTICLWGALWLLFSYQSSKAGHMELSTLCLRSVHWDKLHFHPEFRLISDLPKNIIHRAYFYSSLINLFSWVLSENIN